MRVAEIKINLEKLVDGLGLLFYVTMFIALVTAVTGSPGWGLLFLIFGACALVVRTSAESFVAKP
jgi:hypothetical protein